MAPEPYPLALPSPQGAVFVLDETMVRLGIRASRESPRRRIMLPMQRSTDEGVQRLVNFLQPGSYIRPHVHPKPECVENIAVLAGAIVFLTFAEDGTITSAHRLAAGNPASCMVDIEQGVWHTLVPLADDTVVLEIKRGPYDAVTDKQFAAWSPAEGSPDADAWLREMARRFGEGGEAIR